VNRGGGQGPLAKEGGLVFGCLCRVP